MEEHTSGPWAIGSNLIIRTEGPINDPVADAGYINTHGEAEAKANARLIAAAPDLLAACDEALVFCESVPNCPPIVLSRLQRAIARATGK